MEIGDRVLYYPERHVRPFRGEIVGFVPVPVSGGVDARIRVKWDVEDPDDDDEVHYSVMFEWQLQPLSIVDRLAELA